MTRLLRTILLTTTVLTAPMVALAQTVPPSQPACTVPTSPAFAVLNGVIYGPDQKPWKARGIGVAHGGGDPTASEIQARYPGTNIVRLAIYNYDSPQSLASVVADYTSNGMVVELENHNNGAGNAGGAVGGVFTGQRLTDESNWYASVAAAFISNPYVWFGTNNEPPGSGAELGQWQKATYDAIRGTGNLAPIMIEVNGGTDPNITAAGDPSFYTSMTNIIGDMHHYGWQTNFSTDPNVVTQFLNQAVATAQKNLVGAGGTVPIIIGEFGDLSTAQPVVSNPNTAGYIAWLWGDSTPGSGLNGATAFSATIAQGIGVSATTAASTTAPTLPNACNATPPVVAGNAPPAGTPVATIPTDPTATGNTPPVASTSTNMPTGNPQGTNIPPPVVPPVVANNLPTPTPPVTAPQVSTNTSSQQTQRRRRGNGGAATNNQAAPVNPVAANPTGMSNPTGMVNPVIQAAVPQSVVSGPGTPVASPGIDLASQLTAASQGGAVVANGTVTTPATVPNTTNSAGGSVTAQTGNGSVANSAGNGTISTSNTAGTVTQAVPLDPLAIANQTPSTTPVGTLPAVVTNAPPIPPDATTPITMTQVPAPPPTPMPVTPPDQIAAATAVRQQTVKAQQQTATVDGQNAAINAQINAATAGMNTTNAGMNTAKSSDSDNDADEPNDVD